MKFIAGFLGGLIPAFLGTILVTTTFAAVPEKGGSWGGIAFFIFWILAFIIALSSNTTPKAWRRLLLSSAILSFLAPLSAIIYTGSFIATQANENSAQTVGAAIGGGLISSFMGFTGFFLGVVFLIIGLLVGREKQIVYVEK